MIHVISTIRVQPGKRDACLAVLHDTAAHMKTVPGCLAYNITVDLPSGLTAQGTLRPDAVTLVQQWENLEAYRAHLKSDYMQGFKDKIRFLVRSIRLQVLQPA